MKRLLLTTDDFGMCHAVNAGIVEAMTKGLAASTNFLAPAPWFHEAVALAKEHDLAVGVHLCLGSDWDRMGWGPLTGNARLMGSDGRFPQRPEEPGAYGRDRGRCLRRAGGADPLGPAQLWPAHPRGDPHAGRGLARGVRRPAPKRRREGRPRLQTGLHLPARPGDGAPKALRPRGLPQRLERGKPSRKLAAWTEPGVYHLFGHAAVASPELEALCSPGHPAFKWAAELRLMDQALYLDPSLRKDIENLGFTLVDVS